VTLSDGTKTFTADTLNSAANGGLHGRFFYLPASSAAGTVTYTATWSAARPYRALLIYEYSYSGGTLSLDASNRATGTTGTLNSGPITTTGTETVAFGAYGEYSTTTTTNERIGGVLADQVVRAGFSSMWSKQFGAPVTGAATASGNSATWIGSVIAFKRAVSTAPGVTVAKSSSGSFIQGQTGATHTLSVTNTRRTPYRSTLLRTRVERSKDSSISPDRSATSTTCSSVSVQLASGLRRLLCSSQTGA
jgi:hypothetical protein